MMPVSEFLLQCCSNIGSGISRLWWLLVLNRTTSRGSAQKDTWYYSLRDDTWYNSQRGFDICCDVLKVINLTSQYGPVAKSRLFPGSFLQHRKAMFYSICVFTSILNRFRASFRFQNYVKLGFVVTIKWGTSIKFDKGHRTIWIVMNYFRFCLWFNKQQIKLKLNF